MRLIAHLKYLLKTRAWLGFSLLLCLMPVAGPALSAERSYVYERIEYRFEVRPDTTVRVEEEQTYRFQGEYHQGYRNIPLRGVSSIDQVSVIDRSTGRPLAYSPVRLEKTDPSSYGRYTTYRENGSLIIEWYYDARDTTRAWVLGYTLHGAIGFFDDRDELYWNLFTEYSVPVERVAATVALPAEFGAERISAIWYADPTASAGSIAYPDKQTAFFEASDFPAFGKATIAIGWPRGAIDRSLYWKDWLGTYIWWLLAGAIVLSALVGVALRYILTERWRTGRGTVIAEYEPPRALRPAMAEVIVREAVSDKAWSATIIDLAVRGLLRIEEIPPTRIEKMLLPIIGIFFFAIFGLVVWTSGMYWWMGLLFLAPPFLSLLFRQGGMLPKEYQLTRLPIPADAKLEGYETHFLDILFPQGKKEFSTKEMKRSGQSLERQKMHQGLMALRKELLDETATDTGVYAVDFRGWYRSQIALIIAFVICLILGFMSASPLLVWPILVSGYAILWVILFFRYNPRLSREGQVFREEWLGFKLYLETAERYRLENLTPETFEKYLPYAIIFGVEKKWGQAFETLALEPPRWYGHTAAIPGASFGGAVGGFSAATFSSSFGASFASAFASAGGSSSSSGGGSAGGGGGGGGGGAS